ncbi:hypothetical protein C1645_831894 [Glomus cerebriforme]|uniref:Uncharacterized protein n=1 Tax=Glomus cerebriforme TaxID=658196 RepID=A0A397SPA2_9GLOM|nr:hypothetical protein C1645_831894 [Glomus cerebriforme]
MASEPSFTIIAKALINFAFLITCITEYMDASKSSEAQYTNSDSHNRRSKWNSKDQQFLNASLREHLAKTFGITKIFPLYLDHLEFLMLCYIIEDTFKLVPVNEEEHRLDEEFKNHIEERLKKKLLEAKTNLKDVIICNTQEADNIIQVLFNNYYSRNT